MISHFDLFGTRQVWLNLKQQAYSHLPFHTPMLYKIVRHPLYVGWIIAFWATPTMSAGHLLFAAFMTAYIFAAIPLEERDLEQVFGEQYVNYRNRVGGLIPRLPARRGPAGTHCGTVAGAASRNGVISAETEPKNQPPRDRSSARGFLSDLPPIYCTAA